MPHAIGKAPTPEMGNTHAAGQDPPYAPHAQRNTPAHGRRKSAQTVLRCDSKYRETAFVFTCHVTNATKYDTSLTDRVALCKFGNTPARLSPNTAATTHDQEDRQWFPKPAVSS